MIKDEARVQATASVSHLGVVVKDIDAAKQLLKILFGIGPWWSVVIEIGKDQMIVGEAFKVKVAHARLLENTTIELVEPIGPSIWSDFLTKNGCTDENKSDFHIERDSNTFTIYKKLDQIEIK